ncbi:SpoIIE family protein phosphatase [Trichlorobacter lovleyi]|uniref:PP2C family protein-serine/threonine phosphatase n=1 Tax=Trichlorobacter lovleyi TaxID=313985 RepID=UPI0022400807|nr:SpoIIE family protein phosphatase [Trichlorobacter lovleyi]QOX77948.1 SpoIIE family protein phosphatase [Trichlorobacter lovleyi]
MIQLLASVLNTACVMAVIAYVLVRTRFYSLITEKSHSIHHQILLILLFAAFTMYGVLIAIPIAGGFVALGHIGQIIGGLMAGPLVGTCVGLLIALHRWSLGGFSVVPATLSVILVGLFAGVYALWRKTARYNPLEVAALVIVLELFSSGLTLLLIPDLHQALELEKGIRLPMTIGHMIAGAVFILIFNNIVEARQTVEAKEKIESELRIASNIQMSMVPKTFPPFPDVPEFDVFALLKPAKEVGGDFYDFFFTDNDHICFAIGDVSGKGVPAALFMAVTRTLLKSHVTSNKTIDQSMFKTNNDLCEGNDACMFTTLFSGILDIRTGEFSFSNGGHNFPYLYRKDGTIEMITSANSVALGCMEDMPYQTGMVVLSEGDALVMYTDGVSEAMNKNLEFFTEERLETAIRKSPPSSTRAIVKNLMDEIDGFVAGAPQSDDITLLVFTYNGNKPASPSA